VFTRYPPARIRSDGGQPVALLRVRIAPSYRLVDLPLGPPTTSARSERGTWALFAPGAEVVVVHPDGAVSGPPADVAVEVGRLAAQERQGELDRQAARTIRHLLVGDRAAGTGRARRSADRTWSVPATAYRLSGPGNDHGHDHGCQQAGRFCIATATTPPAPRLPASRAAGSRHIVPTRGIRPPRRRDHRPRHRPGRGRPPHARAGVRHLPVTAGDELVGMVSMRDLLAVEAWM
jgi:hypothetical protein